MVLATTNVGARVKLSATLTNNDVAGNDFLTTINFYTEAFAFRIASVTRTTTCFLMCHFINPRKSL